MGLVQKIFVCAANSLAIKSTLLWETLEDADEGHHAARVERSKAYSGNRLTLERYDCSLTPENPGGKVTKTLHIYNGYVALGNDAPQNRFPGIERQNLL